MVLLGLVLRALGVALLTATVLVPVADHHAAARLPNATAPAVSVHELVTHHHGPTRSPRGAAASLDIASSLPTVLPSASFWAEGAGAPSAASAAIVPADWLAPSTWLRGSAVALPPSFDRAPPRPVPLLPA